MAAASESDPSNDMQREPTTVQEAEQILWHISGKLGGAPGPIKEELQTTSSGVQNYVSQLQLHLRKEAEKLIKITVRSIYTGESRYLYELIQNADDASYALATQNNESPCLTFTLTNEHLYIDTNEDGFHASNVRAICAVSESTKKASYDDDSIGEKGIGFKSVYNIAQSVHVQSGLWSFAFNNDRQDPLSMFIPKPTVHLPVPEGVCTRIALRFREGMMPRIERDLKDLSRDTITFLRKLARLKVVYDIGQGVGDGSLDQHFSKSPTGDTASGDTLVLATRIASSPESHTSTQTNYRVYKQHFADMPEDDRRQKKTAEVQLAFPVNTNGDMPAVSSCGESVFAFLPMWRQRQIPFIIHSDFITNTSRENVVSCAWNERLLECVAQTFVTAIQALIRIGQELPYRWLEYLPRSTIDGYLSPLPNRIFALLKERPVLRAWAENALAPPSRMHRLPSYFIHEQAPLLKDTGKPTIYLAPQYSALGLNTPLSSLGVKVIPWWEKIERLGHHVKNQQAVPESGALKDAWRDSFATFIEKALELSASSDQAKWIKRRLWDLPIIPLRDRWARPSETVYFDQVEDQMIPTNLGLHLVNPDALTTGAQRRMYESLGVSHCDPKVVGDRIMKFQTQAVSTDSQVIRTFVDNLRFLHYTGRDIPSRDRPQLLAVTSENHIRRSMHELYFPSAKQYDTQKLLAGIREAKSSSISLDCDIVLHQSFLSKECKAAFYHGLDWEHWLMENLSIRWYPPLTSKTARATLSPIMSATLMVDSTLFLGTLQAHWNTEYSLETILAGQAFLDHISSLPMLCVDGKRHALKDTFLPVEHLLELSGNLGVKSFLPFLDLPCPVFESHEWEFLEKFGVHSNSDLDYWLGSVRALRDAKDMPPQRKQESARRTYENLGRMANQESQQRIIDYFDRENCVCNPRDSTDWRSPDHCLWKGPRFISGRVLLETCYSGSRAIKNLFVNILGIHNSNADHVMNELESIKNTASWMAPEKLGDYTSASRLMTDVYQALTTHETKDENKLAIQRARFEEGSLIFVEGYWYKPSDCVWDFALVDFGRPKLRSHYEHLHAFFVHKIGVPTVDAIWLLNELQRLAQESDPRVSSVKKIILQLGALIAAQQIENEADFEERLQQFRSLAISPLPVRKGENESAMVKISDSFLINDHSTYAAKFARQVSILDFDSEETRRLHFLFMKLGLQDRYLSLRVDKFSEPVTSEPDARKTEDFRKRAYALACCAAKFKSRLYIGYNTTHNRLLHAQVRVSDDLRTQLRLRVPGSDPVSEKDDQAVPTITGVDSDDITIYLPAAKKDLKKAYRASLPALIRNVLGIKDSAADYWLLQLLTVKLGTIYHVLEDAEAPLLGWLEQIDLSGEEDETDSDVSNEEDEETIVASDHEEQHAHTFSFRGEVNDARIRSHRSATPSRSYTTALPNRPRLSSDAARASSDDFLKLLRNVVSAARQVPGHRTGNGATSAIDRASAFGDPDEPGTNYYAKIGAVGELFVYETLQALNLPAFGLDNWQSKIRRLVKAHPDYADMEPFSGIDMDIVVEDDSGQLEQWLHRKSYGFCPQLPRNEDGSHRKIRFEFEVKSTTGSRSDKMFMSQGQYDRMHRHRLGGDQWSGTVFILARVYDLLRSSPELTLYVDPARFEGSALIFTRGSWTVEAKTLGA